MGILFMPNFNTQIPQYALPHKLCFENPISLVDHIDLLRCRPSSNLHAGLADQGVVQQPRRAKQEKRATVISRKDRSLWAKGPSSLSERRCRRQRARLSRPTPQAPRCSRHRIEPAANRAEGPKGSFEWILEVECVNAQVRLLI